MSTTEVDDVAVDDDKSTTIRSRITLADGSNFEVREKYTTVKRYLEKASTEKGLAGFSTSPNARVAVNPAAVASVEELVRG